jgi:hypothetical protein
MVCRQNEKLKAMGINPNDLTDQQAGLMSLADQEKYRPGLPAPLVKKRKKATKFERLEKEEQAEFARLLENAYERGELIYDWSRTDKRTTNKTGRADFWIGANGRLLQIEFKGLTGRFSPEQNEMRKHSVAAGVDYHVVSDCVGAFALLRQWLEG